MLLKILLTITAVLVATLEIVLAEWVKNKFPNWANKIRFTVIALLVVGGILNIGITVSNEAEQKSEKASQQKLVKILEVFTNEATRRYPDMQPEEALLKFADSFSLGLTVSSIASTVNRTHVADFDAQATGDLNGDGIDDRAIIETFENSEGGNSYDRRLSVYHSRSDKEVLMGTALVAGKLWGTDKNISIADGRIIIEVMRNASTDSACCPSVPGVLICKANDELSCQEYTDIAFIAESGG